MAEDLVNDSSTDVDAAASAFCVRLTRACTELNQKSTASNRKAIEAWKAADQADNPDPFHQNRYAPTRTFRYGAPPPTLSAALPVINFRVSPNKSSSFRTPAEQAREVAAWKSNACWSAHMSDKARHVLPTVDGKPIYEGDHLEELLGEYLPWFKSLWASELSRAGLLNAARREAWLERNPRSKFTDQLHVELPDARLNQTDERAEACVDEYARLVLIPGAKGRNSDFEDALEPGLKTTLRASLEKYQKPSP